MLSSRSSSLVLQRARYHGFRTASRYTSCNSMTVFATTSRSTVFRFRSSSAVTKSTSNTTKSSLLPSVFSRVRWRALARFIKYVRIPFLVVSVYGLGYQQGIVDYARDPATKEHALLDTVLAGVGVTNRAHVDTASSQSWKISSKQARRVAHVGTKIVAMAQLFVKEELIKAVAQAKEKLPLDLNPEQLNFLLSKNEQVIFWDNALKRLEGDWSYMLIQTDVANAFVTEILPKRLFITTGMFQFIENDDELALVLGHEVSHLILGHVTEMNMLQTFMRTIEVLLLSIDPTEGLLSMAVVALLATSRSALTAAHSRDNEHQADDLGIKLAAMACYDTAKASNVFYKMHQHSAEGNEAVTPSYLSFLDSHPPSVERHEQLVIKSDLENVEKYQDTTCASIGSRLKGLLQSSNKEE